MPEKFVEPAPGDDSYPRRGSDGSIGRPGPDGRFHDACGCVDHAPSLPGGGPTQAGDNYPYHYLSEVWHYLYVGTT